MSVYMFRYFLNDNPIDNVCYVQMFTFVEDFPLPIRMAYLYQSRNYELHKQFKNIARRIHSANFK